MLTVSVRFGDFNKANLKITKSCIYKENYDLRRAGWTGPFVHPEAVSGNEYSNLTAVCSKEIHEGGFLVSSAVLTTQ